MGVHHKRNSAKMLFTLLALTGCIVACFADRTSAAEESATEARKVAALVNGQPIYHDQLDAKVDARLRSYRKLGMREKRPDLILSLKRRALEEVIGDTLVRQEAEKITVEDIEQKVDQRVKGLELKHGTGERIDKYLKMRNLTMEGLRESFKKRIQMDEYLKQQGILEPDIPEERIKEMYDGDPESYSVEESVQVSHILIGVDPHAGPDAKSQARQEAEQIRQEILDGKDFAELAKEHSDCNSASGGGRLRDLKRGYMPKEFDEAAFALEKDAISEPVETKFGYHIIKLIDKQSAGVVPYEKMRDFIKKYLQQEESKKLLAAHMVELRSQAKIEILLPE